MANIRLWSLKSCLVEITQCNPQSDYRIFIIIRRNIVDYWQIAQTRGFWRDCDRVRFALYSRKFALYSRTYLFTRKYYVVDTGYPIHEDTLLLIEVVGIICRTTKVGVIRRYSITCTPPYETSSWDVLGFWKLVSPFKEDEPVVAID